MKKTLATIGVITGTAFAGLGVATVASAQVDTDGAPDSTEAPATDESPERDGRRDGKGCNKGGRNADELAATLGIDVETFKAELESGATLAEIAEANGVDPQTLIDQMVADATERIEGKVAEGDLTEDEAAEKLAEKTDRIEDKVFGIDADDSADEDADDDSTDDA